MCGIEQDPWGRQQCNEVVGREVPGVSRASGGASAYESLRKLISRTRVCGNKQLGDVGKAGMLNIPGVPMTLEKWVNDPIILDN